MTMTSARTHRPRVGAIALAATLLCAVPASADDLEQTIEEDQAIVVEDATLDRGHVDVGPRFGPDGWQLMIHDDAAHDGPGTSVWRHPDRTVLRVNDAARLPVPEGEDYAFLGVPGGTEVHVVPQTQDPEVVWLGWNTQDPEVMATIDRGVTLSLVGVDGPGELIVFLQSGSFEAPDVVWDSRVDEIQPAWIPVNTHTHANWVFTEPGVYVARFEIGAELLDGTTATHTGDLRFAIGDEVADADVLAARFPEGAATDTDADTGATAAPGPSDGDAAAAGAAGGLPTGLAVAGGLGALLAAVAVLLLVRGRRAKARAGSEA